MLVRLGEGKGPAYERHIAVVQESLADVGGAVGNARHLAGATEVGSAQHECAAKLINEP
jgi:hypothetical protein